jgi:glycerol-3-phosphate dehydrogenase
VQRSRARRAATRPAPEVRITTTAPPSRRLRHLRARGEPRHWSDTQAVRPPFLLRDSDPEAAADLLIVGGGIIGTGIARDAAGRGLRVVLVERDDLASATSSASSKLIHGGLRYLEQLEFRLVSEALAEREVLLRAAPHLIHPMRFILPHAAGLRPAWLLRAGLLLYDQLARRQTLPPSAGVSLLDPPYRGTLKPEHVRGYAYYDCWVDDARLVIANARAAAEHGARILTRTRCVAAERRAGHWSARLAGAAGETRVEARALVNAAGPWVRQFLTEALGATATDAVRLVQGSHIVVPRLYEGDHAFILQNEDRRVVFVYGYEDHTLIGTTDVAFEGKTDEARASAAEVEYLCRAANRYFTRQIAPADVVWSFCGVRPLIDEGARSPARISRDYRLRIDGSAHEPPLLSVIGGKITVYRRLAERALCALRPWFPGLAPDWTAESPLPGAPPARGDVAACVRELVRRYPQLPQPVLDALARRHGSDVPEVLGSARTPPDLGVHFGGRLYARELDYFITREWARTAEDVLWRRTKEGLHLSADERARVHHYMVERVP